MALVVGNDIDAVDHGSLIEQIRFQLSELLLILVLLFVLSQLA